MLSIKTTTNITKMCDCGRLYCDRISHNGKMMCAACYTGLSLEELQKLYSTPTPKDFKEIFTVKTCEKVKGE